MFARSLFPFDRTPVQTITMVTKGWLRCCSEFHGRILDFARRSARIGFSFHQFGRDFILLHRAVQILVTISM
jgi:hypothetical protein